MEFNVTTIKNHVVLYVINRAFAWCKYQFKNTSNLFSHVIEHDYLAKFGQQLHGWCFHDKDLVNFSRACSIWKCTIIPFVVIANDVCKIIFECTVVELC